MLAALTLIVVCGCSIGGVAIRRGAVAPPPFVIDLGAVQALGRLSTVPVCSYATACPLDPSGRNMTIYTVWLIQRPIQPGAPVRAIRLVSMVVDGGS
ncbi:MAG: hypothetical protein RMJ55_14795 [Roseiflexaceae bacterium]|nr:hypothetical protein [Roseiflexaceae bacterium]